MNVPRGLILLCPQCGGGDVSWESISHRPHCNECKYWAPVNFEDDEVAVREWNGRLVRHGRINVDVNKVLVHSSHCCNKHGCKYGDDNCPVELSLLIQEYPCEFCSEDEKYPDTKLTTEDSSVLLTVLGDLAGIENEDSLGVLTRRGHKAAVKLIDKLTQTKKG